MPASAKRCLACACLLLLPALPACGSQTARAQSPAASPNAFDDYQVIMWVLGDIPENQDLYFQRLRDADVTAIHISPGDSPAPALSHGFGYYVENIHRIGFLHQAHAIYQADWDGYTKTRDKKYLIRKPCLHDPAYLAQAKQDIQGKVRPYADEHPLLYDLGDECSITSFASPMDYCFSEHTLAAFRQWLKGQYGALDRLNAEWETNFKSWEDVVPMTTYEIKDRERGVSSAFAKASADKENYSPWADHRTFMDITFAESWGRFRDWVRELDPKTPVGIEGTQMPAAFGGYDLWRLSQVLDWVEAYDAGGAHAVWRSFLPSGTPILATVFEHDANQASRRLWHLLLNGDRGCIIWASSEWFDYTSPDLTPKPWVPEMGKLFAELRGPAAKAIMQARRDTAPIAIHYSHPSIQVGWMLDSREDGDTWPRRFSSYESAHSRITRVRNSWTKLIEDLGLQYDFVSTQQILGGTLANRGYKVLVLPQSMAIGNAEAGKIEEFAKSGGTVVADFLPGVFDEHGKRRSRGALDNFFFVDRPAGMIQQPDQSAGPGFELGGKHVALGPAEPHAGVSSQMVAGHPAGGATVLARRPVSRTDAWYLNISPIDYAKLRLEGKGGELRGIIADVLTKAGAKPTIAVTAPNGGPPVGFEVITYQGDGKRYLAIMRDPEYEVSDLGEVGYGDNSRFEKAATLTIELPAEATARELLTGRDFGKTKRFEITVEPWKPAILEVR
jgi:hypothetical protein